MYFLYIETGYASTAKTREEALAEARRYYIEKLASQEIEILVEDEE
jgi:hypothetical protein